MEDAKSTDPAAASAYQNWKSKSSLLWCAISCAALIALSYGVALLSAPAANDPPFLSPHIPSRITDEQAKSNQTVENQDKLVQIESAQRKQPPVEDHDMPMHAESKEKEPPVDTHDEPVQTKAECKEQPQETGELSYERRVTEVFERAAMPNRTVIITTLNAAWAGEDTMIDLFLESFWHGEGTHKLLWHVVIVCVDNKAYRRCLQIHPHCIFIKTEGVDFTGEQVLLSADYINLMWRRIEFLGSVLQMNYSFIFTDTDVLWLRNPFPLLESDPEVDFQIACDLYLGHPEDIHNSPNTGFLYVHPNERTVRFFGYWYEQRKRDPHLADQGMLNVIKFDEEFASIGMKLRFLDTQFLGGFCALDTTDMTKALTMHATCCKGLEAKLIDLRMMLNGWKAWLVNGQTLSKPFVPRKRQKRSRGRATLQNATIGPPAPLPSLDVKKVALDARFKAPWACQHSFGRH